MTQVAPAPPPTPSATTDAKAQVRAIVFGHLAGLVVAPTTAALHNGGVLRLLLDSPDGVELADLVARTRANRGYLQVALRLLASAGWLNRLPSTAIQPTRYVVTEAGRVAFAVVPQVSTGVVGFIPQTRLFPEVLAGTAPAELLATLQALVEEARAGWHLPEPATSVEATVYEQVRGHLNGLLVGPALVALARAGVLTALEAGPTPLADLPGDPAGVRVLLELLDTLGWATLTPTHVTLTADGQYGASIATSYGVTVSYLPTMAVVPTLLFGDARIPRFDANGVELLVDRGMNVWGSGGAHKTYFRKIDEVVISIFNGPLEEQPRGICDMGCGDGTLLEHLYDVVRNRTTRGQHLGTHPLIIVGADFNKVARGATVSTLEAACIPRFEVIYGDINRPAQLAADLEQLGYDAHDFLHVRSFLDHNRIYSPPRDYVPGTRVAHSTGAFDTFGEEVPADVLEENLVQHLRRWAPYTGRFGLLAVELHTLPPTLAAANRPLTPAVAYDGTHGYSDQYLVELPVFLACATEAGLQADPRYQAQFPPSELATVSINLFTAARR